VGKKGLVGSKPHKDKRQQFRKGKKSLSPFQSNRRWFRNCGGIKQINEDRGGGVQQGLWLKMGGSGRRKRSAEKTIRRIFCSRRDKGRNVSAQLLRESTEEDES